MLCIMYINNLLLSIYLIRAAVAQNRPSVVVCFVLVQLWTKRNMLDSSWLYKKIAYMTP